MNEGANQTLEEHGKYMLFTRHTLTGTPESSVFMVAYLSPRGAKPYEGDAITATQIYFPGPPNLAVAFLRIETVQDNTQVTVTSNAAANAVLSRLTGAEGKKRTYYRYHMWTKTESEKVQMGAEGETQLKVGVGDVRISDLTRAGIGFVFDDFLIREYTIRHKTFPETSRRSAGCGRAAPPCSCSCGPSRGTSA